jgi:GT2 family glycosyltransferase
VGRKTAAVVIASYNRCKDLARTCTELRKLDPPADEIIICLDGCTDSSREMLCSDFPECRVIENATCQGSIPSRDRAFRLVKSDLIITLDDDSYPMDSAFVMKVIKLADAHPEAGAFTFPEVWNDGSSPGPNLTPQSPAHYTRTFPNCSGVIQRALYGKRAQYPTFFSHMHEEPDFCLQLYGAGYAVWFEPSLTVRHHFTASQRNMLQQHLLNARNELWSVLMRCPFPHVCVVAPLRVLRQFIFAFGQGWNWWRHEPKWWWRALNGIPLCLRNRQPVSWNTYIRWIRLGRLQITQRDELERFFGWREKPTGGGSAIEPATTTHGHG